MTSVFILKLNEHKQKIEFISTSRKRIIDVLPPSCILRVFSSEISYSDTLQSARQFNSHLLCARSICSQSSLANL